MAELQTLARPYAKAVFELAQAGGSLPGWSAQLAALAEAVTQPQLAALIGHPSVSRVELGDLLVQVLGSVLTADGKALIKLLADNSRLKLAPKIAEQFEALRAAAESRVDVEITSAAPVAQPQQQSLAASIGQRLGRNVAVTWKTDESLIAGAVIRAGDLVIDGSVSGELQRLQNTLGK